MSMDTLYRLPKVDLHLHLDGCVRPQTLFELAQEQSKRLPVLDADSLLPYMQINEDCSSLAEYLATFAFVLPYLQTEKALERVAYEVVEQAAKENCLYVEVRFAPLLHTEEGLSLDQVIAAALRGLRLGEAAFGVVARLIIICMRHEPDERNLPVIEAAIRYRSEGVVAVDLAGDEAGYPAAKFRDLFTAAREAELPITIHAGEAGGPVNIKEAVNGLGAVRIGHGVRLREDPDLLTWIRDQGIPLELCPTSNIQTKAVSTWKDYPIRDYYDAGLNVTIHTDNPTVSGTTITQECRELHDRLGFTKEEIAALMRHSLQSAFVEEDVKLSLLTLFDAKLLNLNIHLITAST